jgi:hypothetical protein
MGLFRLFDELPDLLYGEKSFFSLPQHASVLVHHQYYQTIACVLLLFFPPAVHMQHNQLNGMLPATIDNSTRLI